MRINELIWFFTNQHSVINHVILTLAEQSTKKFYSSGFWGFLYQLDWFSNCSSKAQAATGDIFSRKKKKKIRITFQITSRTATTKDYALEWEIACGFLYSRHFLWHTVSTTSSSKKLADFSPWRCQGNDSPRRESGCGHPPVPLLLQHVSKTSPHILVFQKTATGLFHNNVCYILLTFLSLAPFKEENTWIQPLFRVGFTRLNPHCPRDTQRCSLPDTAPVGDRAHFVTHTVMTNMESHLYMTTYAFVVFQSRNHTLPNPDLKIEVPVSCLGWKIIKYSICY